VIAESQPTNPIIFVLSQGAEPTAQFQRLADEKFKDSENTYIIISLGQGQKEPALAAIQKGLATGCWVLLQNCHLYKSFMEALEDIVLQITESHETKMEVHPEFRLFLTSMPCSFFPVPVLQNGIKITNEPPKGIKANMTGSLNQLTEEKLQCKQREAEFRQLILSVCFFHAVIQERRKFGPLGWNIRYEFNESDFETAQTVIQDMLEEETDEIVWDALQFITGQIVYGGRVTDDLDRRCLMSILSTFVSEEVLEPGYKFDRSGHYTPLSGDLSLEGMRSKVKALPDVDSPEIFGMNENADIAFQLQESTSLIDIVLSIQPRTASGGAGKNPDEIVEELADTILEKMPEPLTREGASKELFQVNAEGLWPSLTTFLSQEMDRFNALVSVICSTLHTLKNAIKGLAVMSEEMDLMYNSMLNNKVPENWSAISYPSLKPLTSWIENLLQRIQFLRGWL